MSDQKIRLQNGAMRPIPIPAGFIRVRNGLIREGDRYLNYRDLSETSEPEWVCVDSTVEFLFSDKARKVSNYVLVIRPDPNDGKPCQECGERRSRSGERYCPSCRQRVIGTLRRQHKGE